MTLHHRIQSRLRQLERRSSEQARRAVDVLGQGMNKTP